MNFMFEWQEQYLTSQRSERVRIMFLPREHEIPIFELTCNVLIYDGVDDFPKISDHLPKISEDFLKLFRRQDKRSRTFSENSRICPKIAEDFRGGPEDVSMMHQRI